MSEPGLFGETTRPRKAKPKEDPDPAVPRCVNLFHDEYVRKWTEWESVAEREQWEQDHSSVPSDYLAKPRFEGRDIKQLKALIAAWGEKTVSDMIRLFFSTRDQKVERYDYGLRAFTVLADHVYLLLKGRYRRGRLDQRQAANIEAAERAIGKHR
jgi:hypothetical protein